MKFLHCADLHLDSTLKGKFDDTKITETRRKELRKSFTNLVEYAKSNNIKAIIMSGDVFEKCKPSKENKDLFYGTIKSNPEIDFLFLRGNHDYNSEEMELPNLKTFDDKWKSYEYENVVVSGIELSEENYKTYTSTLLLDKDKFNIVMLHGQIGTKDNEIRLNELKNKGIDYLALGHIHLGYKGELDDRGVFVYPGCLEPRGFDEIGEKGFYVVEVNDDKTFKYEFIRSSIRTIYEYELDITKLNDNYEIQEAIKKNFKFNKDDMYRINLVGEIGLDMDDICNKELISDLCYFIDLKDKTVKAFDIEKYKADLSLKGEFVRKVLSDTSLSDDEKYKIIKLGVKALEGGLK